MKKGREKKHRICAAFLCVCMLLSLPGISDIFPVVAAAEQAESFQKENVITAFDPLPEDIKVQTVFVGTNRDELDLPEELTVCLLQESSEQKAEESEQENVGETDDIEENSDTETKDEQDTQTEESEVSGETGDSTEADNENVADSEDIESSEGESAFLEEERESVQERASSEEQQENATAQENHTVTIPEYYAENVIPVQTLANTSSEKQEETVTISGITWQSEPEYDENTEGIYTFTAILPDDYTLADGVSLPEITVTVKESGSSTDTVIQTLLDRIAALPEVEDWLSSEPDMDDGDAYTEWEEKLYEYAEEALAIWEEYEALTEEQQAQITEEELAKLEAWVEIAETLSDNNAVMLASYSEHHGESNWTALTASDTTLTDGKYYLSGDITMDTITINGADNSNVTLCLNGHTLTHDDSKGGSVIVVASGKFTLCDCKDDWGYTSSFDENTKTYTCGVIGTGGRITGSSGNDFKGGGVYVSSGATFNMNSGRITGCDVGTAAGHDGGGVAVIGGTFNMSGGYIDGNKAYIGGGVYLTDKATFNMSGNAVIMNNEGTNGGGVYCQNSKQVVFTMDAGAIIGNKVSTNGGGVFLGMSSTFNMNGGTIEGNCTTSTLSVNPAGIYVMSATINLAGDCSIRYNKAGAGVGGITALLTSTISVSGNICIADNYGNGDGTESNVLLTNLPITVTDELTNDIGVTYKLTTNKPVSYPVKVVTGTASYPISDADWSHFSSDNKTYEIQKKETEDTGNELYLAEPGSCDLFTLSVSEATLSSPFDPNTTYYTSEVTNRVDHVGITATLASTASGADITIKISDGTTATMENGVSKTVDLVEGENTIVIIVTSGKMSKAYTIKITREEAKGNPVTITTYKDGNVWTGAGAPSDYKLTSDGGSTFLPSLVALDGTYKIYSGDTDTGVEVTVSGAEVTAKVDYYTVTFYDGTTELQTLAQQIVLKGAVASAPTDTPAKTGYTFSKWVTADGSSTEYDFSGAVTGKTSVYASWTPDTYKIAYDLAGGELPAGKTNPTTYTIETADFMLQNPERIGYSFAGWSGTGLTADSTAVTIVKGSTGDREYTANWKAESYTVTLNGKGDSGSDLTEYTCGTGATLPTDWTKTGYTFAGWYNNENCIGNPVTEISATETGDKTFWAKWTPQTYQVTLEYHGADGGNSIASQNVTYDSKYGNLPTPTRTGYTFKGWYTAEAGGSEVNADTVVREASAHTLHARWKDETPPDKPVLQNGVTLPAGWTKDQTTIPLKLYDGVGVAELWVSIDGKDYTKVDGFSGGTGSVNYEYTVQSGEHTYQFMAKDAAGNTSAASDTFTVRLDQENPVIGTLTYENKVVSLWNWIIGKKSMIVHVPVTDTGSGVTEISCILTPRDAAGNLNSSRAVTKTATVTDGEAKITFDDAFRGTITITCTDAAGNAAAGVTVGKDAGGVIVEDQAPTITILADRNISDMQGTHTRPDGVDVSKEYYNSAPALFVTVKDDTNNAITAGIAAITYQVEGGEEKKVTVAESALQAEVLFTIPANEIPTGITKITIKTTDNAGNTAERIVTINVKGPEKQPAAVIDYRQEELTGLVPGGEYLIGGETYTADQEGHIPIKEDWLGNNISIVKEGNDSETSDSPAQNLSVPARQTAPDTPELSARTENSITLKTITGAQYRFADGTGNWQDSTVFEGLNPKTPYSFIAYYPATDTSFASKESGKAEIATMPTPPTPEQLGINYEAETLAPASGIEAFSDAGCTTPVTAGSAEDYMGTTVYIRYQADGIIPASAVTPVSVPERTPTPTPGTTDASYPKAEDGKLTGLTAGGSYMLSLDGGSTWQSRTANESGEITGLKAGTYELYVAAGSTNFRSETASVTVGAKPATKYDTPAIQIDYDNRTLTGFEAGGTYHINGEEVSVRQDGTIEIEAGWFGTTLSIIRKGNDKDKADSDAQSLFVPTIPPKPTPTGVDVSTAGGTGKLTGLTAGTTYELSTDGGRTWQTQPQTADGNGEITGLAPGTYVVRIKAGTSNFASEPSEPATIGAYKVTVTFMVDGTVYKEIPVDYGTALTDIPPVPGKDGKAGEWCVDAQGSSLAKFTNITADMTVYAVYTTAYTVTLQGGEGYVLSAENGSTSPVKEGGSFTFRFELKAGYHCVNGSFAVMVDNVKVELINDTYTITDIRRDLIVKVVGVEKDADKPSGGGGNNGDDDDDSEPTPTPTPEPTQPPTDTPPTTPTPQPTTTPGTTPPVTENESEGRRPETTPEPEETQGPQEPESNETQPTSEPSQTQTPDTTPGSQTYAVGNGAVIVTLNNVDETVCAARVADAAAVAHAVLSQEELAEVKQGQIIEIRIDVERLDVVTKEDAEVIGKGIEDCQEQIPGLAMGMYVDISMYMRIGSGDWNAIHATNEPVEIILDVPDEFAQLTADFYIMRAHEGEYLLMEDLDEAAETITIQTEAFSTYAILYQMQEGGERKPAAKCSLCHICPTFLGICYFIWLAIIIALVLVIYLIIRRKRREEESEVQ